MSKDLPVLLLTGASQRLGASLAEAFAARGYAIVLHTQVIGSRAHKVQERIEASGGVCALIEGDLMDPALIDTLFVQALLPFGRVDFLINNASRFMDVGIKEADREHYTDEMHLHATAPYVLTRALYLHLKEREAKGAVINICDASLAAPKASKPAYYAAKGALVAQTRALAVALGPTLRVNSLSPGPVLEGASDGAYYTKMKEKLPVGRLGAPADIIEAAAYLLDAAFVTGINLVVDGGAHLL